MTVSGLLAELDRKGIALSLTADQGLLARGEEPFPAIRARAQELKPGAGIIIVAPFLPSPLIERLGSEGFASKVERGSVTEWLIYFWRALD